MRQEVRWTDLTYEQIADHLAEAGTPVSVPVVKQLLKKHGYVKRKAQKSKAMGSHPDQEPAVREHRPAQAGDQQARPYRPVRARMIPPARRSTASEAGSTSGG